PGKPGGVFHLYRAFPTCTGTYPAYELPAAPILRTRGKTRPSPIFTQSGSQAFALHHDSQQEDTVADSLKSARRRALTRSRLGFDHLDDRAAPAALTYVAPDANYDITLDTGPSGFSPGDVVTWNPGQPNQQVGLIAGINAFDTIQGGVDNTDVGGTVNVAAGTYTENVTVSNRLTMLGAGDGTDAAANTIIQSAVANTPVLTLATGGTSASARMDIEGIRVTGTTGTNGNPTNGISING